MSDHATNQSGSQHKSLSSCEGRKLPEPIIKPRSQWRDAPHAWTAKPNEDVLKYVMTDVKGYTNVNQPPDCPTRSSEIWDGVYRGKDTGSTPSRPSTPVRKEHLMEKEYARVKGPHDPTLSNMLRAAHHKNDPDRLKAQKQIAELYRQNAEKSVAYDKLRKKEYARGFNWMERMIKKIAFICCGVIDQDWEVCMPKGSSLRTASSTS